MLDMLDARRGDLQMFYFSLLKFMIINSQNIMAIQQIPVWYVPTNAVKSCHHSGFEQIFPGLQPRLLTLEVSRIFIIICTISMGNIF